MLLGARCAANIALKPKHAVQAIDRLQSALAFIGITDLWAPSICLFHRQFGNEVDPTEMINVRQSDTLSEAAEHQASPTPDAVDTEIEVGAVLDPYDMVVFQAALRLFAGRCKAWRVKLPPHVTQLLVDAETLCRVGGEGARSSVLCSDVVHDALGNLTDSASTSTQPQGASRRGGAQ